ncbi:hypothetical protein [Terriglobus sp.]|uniref:hypothetical protein n=1 Tax=Terriglobus sp. TaxID=1889013 RepID=UPI003B009826
MGLNRLRFFVLSGVVCSVLAAPGLGVAQTAQSSGSDASAPTTAQGQEASLKNEEKANKQRAKAAKAQRKALQAQDKAAKAAKKAGEQPATSTASPQ